MTTGSDDVGTHKAPTPLYYTTPPKAVSDIHTPTPSIVGLMLCILNIVRVQ